MTWMLDRVGRHIAAYLQRPASGYEPFTPTDPAALRTLIKPGDILLIEGRTHIAGVIKYLTQSTWSHAALYVGPIEGQETSGGEPCDLVESNMEAGIISVPLSTYFDFHTRICRPVGLLPEDRQAVCERSSASACNTISRIVDPTLSVPPVPQRFRRRMIALGSGDPTKLICSALIARAFGAIGYPILPAIERVESAQERRDIYHIRHSSLYCPRDFDISPYFAVIKPTIELGFDYKTINWSTKVSSGGS
jgi:hypothetical protein